MDFRSHGARTLGKRLRQVRRLDIAVVRVADRADDAIRLAEWPKFLHLLRRELFHLDADRLGDAGIIHELVPAVFGAGEADIRD